jgi:hypothetical protein
MNDVVDLLATTAADRQWPDRGLSGLGPGPGLP